MPKFGATSKKNLAECDPRLQKLFNFVIEHWDCAIIDGARTIEEQRKNVAKGVSKTMASKHLPDAQGNSRAVDAMPYPFNWNEVEKGMRAIQQSKSGMAIAEVYMFAGFVAGAAAAMNIPIRQGADWNSDREFSDQSFHDLPHTEILGNG